MNEEQIQRWVARDPDPETRDEIEGFLAAGDHGSLSERFLERLRFGTAGLRGLLGGGPCRMNRLVVIEASLAFARVTRQREADASRAVVAYDARHRSIDFARDAAAAFAEEGFQVFLFPKPVPTPLAAFAVRYLRASAGVVITASHNPPGYSGYKAYGSSAAQLVEPWDQYVSDAISSVAAGELPPLDFDHHHATGRISIVENDVVERYLTGLEAMIPIPKDLRRDFPIAYTPLHGVALELTGRTLERYGFNTLHVVGPQARPDPEFPSVRFPNPEEPGTLDALIARAHSCSAEIAFAHDPDGDRLAVAVAVADGRDYRIMTGDELGTLLGAYFLGRIPRREGHEVRVAAHSASPTGTVATTIVSATLLEKITKDVGAGYFETLTGFKWIARGSIERQARGERFIFGYEEALGYCIGDLVRDKDGVSALVAVATLHARLRAIGWSLVDALDAIYRHYGVVVTMQRSLALEANQTRSLLRRLRARSPAVIAGHNVVVHEDFLNGRRYERGTGGSRLELPRSNVLRYHLDGGARVALRPSGTEPKVKCYYLLSTSTGSRAPKEVEAEARRELCAIADAHCAELDCLISA